MSKTCYIKLFAVLTCWAAIFGAHGQPDATIQAQLAKAVKDTTRIRLLNKLAELAYLNNQFEACKLHSKKALQLTDKLLQTPAIVSNTGYHQQCLKWRAKSLENYGSSLMYADTNAARDTLLLVANIWASLGDEQGIASVYLRLAEMLMNQTKFDEAIFYYKKSLAINEALKNNATIQWIYYEIALTQRYQGNYGDALESNLTALRMAQNLKDTTSELLCMLANGFIYMQARQFKDALAAQQAALKYAMDAGKASLIATAYSDLGVTNFRMGKMDEALLHHNKALAIRISENDLLNVSSSYNYISSILSEQGKYQEALKSNLEGIEYARQIGDGNYLIDCYYLIAENYINLNEYNKALVYYDTTMQAGAKINSNFYLSLALQGRATVYSRLKQIPLAITCLKNAIAVTGNQDYRSLRLIYDSLKSYYAQEADFKNAYYNSLLYNRYSDTISLQEKTSKITSLTKQLEFENKRALLRAGQDKQLAIQQSKIEKEKILKNIFIAGLLIVIGLALLFFIRLKEKHKLNTQLELTVKELKSTQTQLIQSEKMASLGELTAGISHEIQNPLNFVNNFSEVSNELLDEMLDEIENENYQHAKSIANELKLSLEKINFHGNRAGSIVKGMLQHSRNSNNQKELTDLNALCDEYLRLSYHGLRAKDKSFNAKFDTDFDSLLPPISVVPQEIGRVILNLINNAFYAVNERKKLNEPGYEPSVIVSTKKENENLIISVKDNGIGIPTNIVDKIFQPFFTTKPTGSGTGLGLSLSYDIVTKGHGGALKVETKEGTGTSFQIKLPIS